MRNILAATSLAAVLAASTALASCSGVDPTTTASVAPDPMATVVRITLPDGAHGSGFHIGGGMFVTAAHVVTGQIVALLEFEGGAKENATVAWDNRTSDVGTLRADRPYVGPSATIECRDPAVGEQLTAYGNPGQDNFLAIPATVVGAARERAPNWRKVVPVALGAQGGISGGPAFDADGDVVGIVVGAPMAVLPRTLEPQTVDDYDLSITGIAYIVPGTVLCEMLGRA